MRFQLREIPYIELTKTNSNTSNIYSNEICILELIRS